MKYVRQLAGLTLALMTQSVVAQEEVTVYGRIHLSADVVDTGASRGHGLSSNASRIGFKGKKDLNYGLKALWKIETELDVSSEVNSGSKFTSRNRYLGLNYGRSTVVAGYHDTPFRTLGKKIDVLPDTVADRRGVLGRDYIGDASFDVRADNAVMYVNKFLTGLELRFMRSAGSSSATVGDKTPITSTSLLYKTSQFMLGAAYEIKEAAADRTAGVRLLGGVAFDVMQITAIYEQLDFGDSNARLGWDRSVAGLSAVYKSGLTSFKAQVFVSNNLSGVADSSGRMFAGGVYHELDKSFEIYGIAARVTNEANAKYTLTGANHGDVYRPSAAGADMNSVSFGGIYKF